MEEMLEVTLGGGRTAPGFARTALHGLNGSLGEVGQSVSLLVSELVTNAVKHGDVGPDRIVRVRLASSDERVRVEVIDEGPGFQPRPSQTIDPIEDGFGLALVERLSDRWGVAVDNETRVWFEIDRKTA